MNLYILNLVTVTVLLRGWELGRDGGKRFADFPDYARGGAQIHGREIGRDRRVSSVLVEGRAM